MKKRLSRSRQIETNPVTLALQAAQHSSRLIDTLLSFQYALAAVESGDPNQTALLQLEFMCAMTNALERAGFAFEGMDSSELHDLVKSAIEGLKPTDLRLVYDMHRQQCEAATASQYLLAFQSL